MEILDGMRKRLKRRNILLDEVRKAYLSDLVASNAPIKKRASAINLQPMLALYAPSECTYELIHGEGIDHGGHVEIIHRESKHVADISSAIAICGALGVFVGRKLPEIAINIYSSLIN